MLSHGIQLLKNVGTKELFQPDEGRTAGWVTQVKAGFESESSQENHWMAPHAAFWQDFVELLQCDFMSGRSVEINSQLPGGPSSNEDQLVLHDLDPEIVRHLCVVGFVELNPGGEATQHGGSGCCAWHI